MCGANGGGWAGGARVQVGPVSPPRPCALRVVPEGGEQHHNPSRHLSVAKQPAVNGKQTAHGRNIARSAKYKKPNHPKAQGGAAQVFGRIGMRRVH